MKLTASLLAAACVAASLRGQTPPEHDVTEQSVVWVVPGLERVAVRGDVPYKTDGAKTLGLDVYSPPGLRAGELRPAVVFINGVGDAEGRSLKD
jgi:hypothetical protein